MTRKIVKLLLAAACVVAAAGVQAADNRVTLDDVAGIITVSDPQLSPDGKSIIVVVAHPNLKDARYDRSLVLVDVASGTQRTLTYGRRAVGSPRWSPSGDQLAFLDKAPPGPVPEAPAAAPAKSDAAEEARTEPHTQVFV